MKKSYSKNNKCIECGKLIINKAKRCQSCSKKELYKDPKNHPNFGKHPSESTRKNMSKTRKGKNNSNYIDGRALKKFYCAQCDKKIRWQTVIYGSGLCKSCSMKELFTNRKNTPRYGKKALKSKRIYYKNICFRSSWEAKFAQFLDLSGIKYLYESKRFYFEDCTYLPDFYIPIWNLYIEIKGWWRNNGKRKLNLFKKYYTKENIKVLMKPDLQKIGVLYE